MVLHNEYNDNVKFSMSHRVSRFDDIPLSSCYVGEISVKLLKCEENGLRNIPNSNVFEIMNLTI